MQAQAQQPQQCPSSTLLSMPAFVAHMSQPGAITKWLGEYEECVRADVERPALAMAARPLANKYKDIKCFDHTRVVLTPTRTQSSDYIHANWVHAYDTRRLFIATQAPLPDTVGDFWRMVWQQQSVIVLSLTKLGGPKCMMYFPDTQDNEETHGDISVCNKGVLHRDNFDAVSLHLRCGDQVRRCLQLTYYSWPDKSVPSSSTALLNLIHNLNYNQQQLIQDGVDNGSLSADHHPIVVHCSAGVGRTGTLIALHIACRQMDVMFEQHGQAFIDIPGIVRKLRQQRHNAVQRPMQYVFLQLAALDYAIRKAYADPAQVNLRSFFQAANNQ